MRLLRVAILLILVGALLLNGCDTSPLSRQPTAAPTSGAAAPTEMSPTETPVALTQAEAADAEPTNVGPPAGPVLTDTLQVERIAINASGELEPTVITATAGLTIELELLNRSEAESLLIFDLAPAGSLGIYLPAAAPLSDTAPITSTAAPPTSTAISAPTTTVSTSTPEPTVPPSLVPPSAATNVPTATQLLAAISSPTATSATPPITATDRLSAATIWLRYDTVGAYLVRCAPELPGTAPGCSGSVEIRVAAPGSIPPATPAPLDAAPTATTAPTSTTTLTSTAALATTSTLAETAESAATDTPIPMPTEVITATAAP